MKSVSRNQLIDAYQQACEIELQAFKPGNVSVYADGHDMTVEDFRRSAKVSAGPITDPEYSLGEKIYYAIQATRDAVGCNTNLGIVLLCAPMIHAINGSKEGELFRDSLLNVLNTTTINDADWTFKAISLAAPGGLGESANQDVRAIPTVTLTESMEIASNKDRIALQYVNGYKDIFEFAILRYNNEFNRWEEEKWAALSVYTGLLCQFPDSHIERKFGNQFNELVYKQMALLDSELSKTSRPETLENMLASIDREFKTVGINPGTTADMTVATLLAVFLEKLTSGG